jgi:5-hydroxyisourate hydrolase-like protein (transthyretin family)
LKVVVQDAAGNSAVGYDGTISTKQPSNNSLGAHPGPGTTTGTSPAATVAIPNGTTASRTARLSLGVRRRMTRTYSHRGLRVTGRLLDGQGRPIAGATLDVLQQVSGSPTLAVIGHASTRANGTFAAMVPGGPSRRIEIAYRAFSTDASYAATAKIAEAVEAGVQLTVSPRRTGSEGTITLSGHVLGPVPAQGVAVELLVHYRGRWEPFRVPQTDSRGRFEVVYQFQGGVGRFPFRASVLGGQAAFPFAHGESRAVDVVTD